MQKKAFVIQNKGMNRDLSVSKAGESSAYENHNIRILARDNDTLMSVTGERGNKLVVLEGLEHANLRITEDEEFRITEDELYRIVDNPNAVMEEGDFAGILIGWNVLNNHVILFTNEGTTDRIYRVDYEDDKFFRTLLFEGELGFALNNPIESVVYFETKDIQKIYWVDGKNVLRFMNFMEEPDDNGHFPWQDADGVFDNTYFDSNRVADFGVNVDITKDNSGNTRPNGVIQYFLTYYNKHGQETGFVWGSDLIYLSPVASGGAADGSNTNSVTLSFSNLDPSFSHFRVYSVFRSSLNGETLAYIVFDGTVPASTEAVVSVIDSNSHLVVQDATALLYLGSVGAVAGTLAHKDQTLFLGDFTSVGREGVAEFEPFLKGEMVEDGWHAKHISFRRVDSSVPVSTSDTYSYESQMSLSSSEITTFKGGEKYRFGLSFRMQDGTMTDAFWIGDAVNPYYPKTGKRVIAECELPATVVARMKELGFHTAQLMIAEATYADRSVKAQGIVNPTVFNVWERYNNRLYASASWLMRPRNAEFAWKHFEPVHTSTSSTGEIDCNYWQTLTEPTPYYRLHNYATHPEYMEKFDGVGDYNYVMILYYVGMTNITSSYYGSATAIFVKAGDGFSIPYTFSEDYIAVIEAMSVVSEREFTFTDSTTGSTFYVHSTGLFKSRSLNSNETITFALNGIQSKLRDFNVPNGSIVDRNTFFTWCEIVDNAFVGSGAKFFSFLLDKSYDDIAEELSDNNWYTIDEQSFESSKEAYRPSYYKKHLMFVDENTVTLNSPEIEYEAVSFDNADEYKFRIIGAAKVSGNYNDYVVDANPGHLAGENLIRERLSNHLLAWPVWKETGLRERQFEDDGETEYTDLEPDIELRDSDDYQWGGSIVRYWLRMWGRSGKISGYNSKEEEKEESVLRHKTFANLKFANETFYNDFGYSGNVDYDPKSVRIFNYASSQYLNIRVGDEGRYYNGVVNDALTVPGSFKYPITYSVGAQDTTQVIEDEENAYLFSADPVQISYASNPHVVLTLPSRDDSVGSIVRYQESILPRMFSSEFVGYDATDGTDTGALLPWINNTVSAAYKYKDYKVVQPTFALESNAISDGDKYLYIGEIYRDLPDDDQVRYGGTTDAAVKNCRFIVAGPQAIVASMTGDGADKLIANQGDTFYQRWDCLKTKPYSTGALNNVIDVTSVMLESHINLDGRTDLQRGVSELASIDYEKFGSLNRVYSQANNFIVKRDLDEDFNLDTYRSTISWTMEKHDSADVDEWSHITLANTLKLDGDKGTCNAIRRMQNSLIAFQDRGISEILFNSRTQISTQDGVPIEIANSGKVDGKRYITNKYGCTNKWSIVEGKAALYFVDNINKAFCGFNGSSIDNISNRLGFGVWFRNINDTTPWRPVEFNNLVSYYDRIHSDVYLVRNSEEDPCLVYNENAGVFTSFFDYRRVLMMTDIEDKFVSYKNQHLWKQNEGLFCNFFGEQYDAWAQYRVTPEPYSDKVWTNLEYRTDFYCILDGNGNAIASEGEFTSDEYYQPNETYDYMRFWDEYQTTADEEHYDFKPEKKFRLWRLQIPRAVKNGKNRFGLDRIRNPWLNLFFKKRYDDTNNTDLMQIHDITVIYYE